VVFALFHCIGDLGGGVDYLTLVRLISEAATSTR